VPLTQREGVGRRHDPLHPPVEDGPLVEDAGHAIDLVLRGAGLGLRQVCGCLLVLPKRDVPPVRDGLSGRWVEGATRLAALRSAKFGVS